MSALFCDEIATAVMTSVKSWYLEDMARAMSNTEHIHKTLVLLQETLGKEFLSCGGWNHIFEFVLHTMFVCDGPWLRTYLSDALIFIFSITFLYSGYFDYYVLMT